MFAGLPIIKKEIKEPKLPNNLILIEQTSKSIREIRKNFGVLSYISDKMRDTTYDSSVIEYLDNSNLLDIIGIDYNSELSAKSDIHNNELITDTITSTIHQLEKESIAEYNNHILEVTDFINQTFEVVMYNLDASRYIDDKLKNVSTITTSDDSTSLSVLITVNKNIDSIIINKPVTPATTDNTNIWDPSILEDIWGDIIANINKVGLLLTDIPTHVNKNTTDEEWGDSLKEIIRLVRLTDLIKKVSDTYIHTKSNLNIITK